MALIQNTRNRPIRHCWRTRPTPNALLIARHSGRSFQFGRRSTRFATARALIRSQVGPALHSRASNLSRLRVVPRTSFIRERHLCHRNFLGGQLAIMHRENVQVIFAGTPQVVDAA
jgi:hypothetical protein